MWCDYSIDKLKPLIEASRFDDNRGTRFYYFQKDGDIKIAAGVTSVIGLVSTERKAIDQWKQDNDNWKELLNSSSDYGTLLHATFADIILGKGVNIDRLESMRKVAITSGSSYDMASKDLLSFLKFHEDYQIEPLIIEGILIYHDKENDQYLAMTIDLLAQIKTTKKTKTAVEDGVYVRGEKKGQTKYKDVTTEEVSEKIVLIDFKSNFFEKDRKSFYESHKLQLMFAKLAVEQNFDLTVDSLFNLSPGNTWRINPDYTFKEWNITDEDWGVLGAYWQLAIKKGINVPTGKIFVPGAFSASTDYKFLSYEEYVREILLPVEKIEENKDIMALLAEE